VSSGSLIDTDRQPYIGIFWDLLGSGLWEIFGSTNEQHQLGEFVKNIVTCIFFKQNFCLKK
jgi:hypothetical protein